MNKNTVLKYLAEFALVFVSVIAAFLFDSARERRQLKERELLLLRDVTTDLGNDTIQYNMRINQAKELKKELTDLIVTLESNNASQKVEASTFFKPIEIVLNKTTFETIKSTGGFEFVADKELVKGFSEYYNSRAYISEIMSRIITDIDGKIADMLIQKTRFTENKNPLNSYLIFSHTIDQKSLNTLIGNQVLINLLYMKRTFLDQLITVFSNVSKPNCKRLNAQCNIYLSGKL